MNYLRLVTVLVVIINVSYASAKKPSKSKIDRDNICEFRYQHVLMAPNELYPFCLKLMFEAPFLSFIAILLVDAINSFRMGLLLCRINRADTEIPNSITEHIVYNVAFDILECKHGFHHGVVGSITEWTKPSGLFFSPYSVDYILNNKIAK